MNNNLFPRHRAWHAFCAAVPLSAFFLFFACCLSGLAPRSASGWGSTMHKIVGRAAVGDLPLEMIGNGSDNAFAAWRDYLVEHSNDPDINKDNDPLEGYRHYMDIDMHIDQFPFPFTSIPRDENKYLTIFERGDGVLPWEGWRDPMQRLTDDMRQRDWNAAYLEAACLSHYVADAYTPLHATANYNGYLSDDSRNRGIHSRHETTLANKFITSATTSAGSAIYISDPLEEAFSTLANSWTLSQAVLAADLAAQDISGYRVFDSVYYDEFWSLIGEETQKQIDDAARMTASMWFTAWVNAGRPRFSGTPTPSAWIFY